MLAGGSNHNPLKSGTYRFLSLLHVLNRCRVCNLEQFHPLQAAFHTPNVKLVRAAHFAAGTLADWASNVFFSDIPGPVLPVFHRPGAETCGSSAHGASVLSLIPPLSRHIKAFRGLA